MTNELIVAVCGVIAAVIGLAAAFIGRRRIHEVHVSDPAHSTSRQQAVQHAAMVAVTHDLSTLNSHPPTTPLVEATIVPTVAELIADAAELEGVELTTLTKAKPFQVRAARGGIEILPSSGSPRLVNPERLQAVCEEFGRSRSLRPSNYTAITFDASYLLVLIDRWLQKQDLTRDNRQGFASET